MAKREDPRDAMAARIIEEMAKGTAPWEKPWQALAWQKNARTGRPYLGFNAVWLAHLMGENGYETPLWATWPQLKQLGGHPKGDEWDNGHVVVWFRVSEKDKVDGDGRPVLDDDGDPVRVKLFFSGKHRVWNVDQTTLDRSEFAKLLPPPGSADRKDDAEAWVTAAIAAGSSAPISEDGAGKAFYSPKRDRISVPTLSSFKSSEGYYQTIFHEMVHSTGHKSRLARGLGNRFGDPKYAAEELVAEFGAAFAAARFGMEARTQHAAYLRSWAKDIAGDPKVLWLAVEQAKKAVDLLNKSSEAEAKKAA